MTTPLAAKRCVRVRRALRGWRSLLACYVLLAVAWPAAGPLPWLAFEHGSHHAAAHGGEHHAVGHHADRGDYADPEHDDADVPGSPTHPLDHDCAQCQVLKHLARCVLPDLIEATVPPPPGNPVHAFLVAGDLRTGIRASRPLIRGPPLLLS